jgi:2-methylcitrate dehydratase PrpD
LTRSRDRDAAAALIDHALGLRWSDLTEDVRHAARTFLHDTLCVGVAGANAPYAEAVRATVAGWGAGNQCTVLGSPSLRLPAPAAAFVNAFQIHAQEFDCVHEGAVVHPMATVLAALLAEAERSGPYGGGDFLAALIAGVDVAAGLGVAVTSPVRFFRPATAGIFGSVAGLARLKGLARPVALDALGYGLAFASGTMQAHVEGTPALPIQVANAARGAIMALDLATAGLPGPHRSIDGPFGYLPLFETDFDIDRLLDGLGGRSRIAEVSWKPFPTGRAAHGAIVAIQTMMGDAGLTADTLAALSYRAPPLIRRLVGRPAVAGMLPAYARLCLPFLAAVALTRGTVRLADFDAATLSDPALLSLARRIGVEHDGNPNAAAFVPAEAVARLTDGREIRLGVTAQFGSPSWPLSPAEHLRKCLDCLEFGGQSAAHEPLSAAIGTIESAQDVAALLNLALHQDRR